MLRHRCVRAPRVGAAGEATGVTAPLSWTNAGHSARTR